MSKVILGISMSLDGIAGGVVDEVRLHVPAGPEPR
jgi:hypothetical protein